MRLLKLIFLLVCLTTSTLCYINQINREKTLWAYSNLNVKNQGTIELNFCFKGLDSQTNVLILQDREVSNINELFSSNITIREGVFSKDETAVDSVTWNLALKQLSLSSSFFKTFSAQNTYCLKVLSSKDASPIKNLEITAASTDKANRIEYNLITSFTSIELYSTKVDNTESAFTLGNISDAFNPTAIYDVTYYNVKFTANIILPTGKLLPTEKDQVLVFLDFPNIDVSRATINLTSLTDGLALSVNPSFDIRKNRIIISNFGANFKNKDSIQISVGNIKSEKYFSDSMTVSASLYWKNTNSLVSFYKLDLSKTLLRYQLNNLSLAHVNKVPHLYSNSAWPLEFTFSITKDIIEGNLSLRDANGVVKFIPSTCDFSANPGSITSCSTNSGSSQLNLSKINVFKNTVFTTRVWVYLEHSDSATIAFNDILSINLSAEMLGETDSTSFSPSFKIKKYYNNIDQNTVNANNQCIDISPESPVNCVSNLVINENVGNFVLLENEKSSRTDLDLYQTRNLSDFKNLKTKYFKLRFRHRIAGSGRLSRAWAGEWTNDSLSNIDASQFPRGTHNFYFPEFYRQTDDLSCRVAWASSLNAENNVAVGLNRVVLDYKYEVDAGTIQMLYNNFFESSGIRQNNRLYFNNWNLVAGNKLLQRGLFHGLVRSVNCSADFLDCQTSSSNNSNTNVDIDLELASNCYLYNSDYTYKSIYTSFDLNHQFNLDSSNNNAKYFVRSNRFVSLLPQPGVFRSVEEAINSNDGNSQNIFKNAFVFQTSNINYDAVCLIELNLSLNSLSETNYSNVGVNLHGYLTGVELIDFESMNDYPVNRHSLSVIKNTYMYASTPHHTSLVNLITNYQGDSHYSYSKSEYSVYFGSALKFRINTSELGQDIDKDSTVIVPIKCNTDPQIVFAFSDILTTENKNTSQVIYSPVNSYDNGSTNTYKMTQQIYSNFNGINNVGLLTATWQHFVFEKNTKITFTTNETKSFREDAASYMALLLKDDITEDERLLDYNNVEVLTTKYIQLYKYNPFTINGTKFNYLLIKDKISDKFDIKDGNQIFKFALQGIPVHINPNDPVKNNDIAIFISGESSSNSSISNYLLTNFDGSNYLVNTPPKTSITNDAIVVKSMDYITSILKSGEGGKTACASVELVIVPNVVYFEVYSESFNSRTLAEGNGFDAEFQYDINVFKGKAPVFDNTNINNNIKMTFCNLDVSPVKKFKITRIVFFFKNATTEYIDYNLTDTQVFEAISSTTAYQAGRITAFSYGTNRKSYGLLTLGVTLDNEVYRNMKLTIEADLRILNTDDYITPSCLPYFEGNSEHNVIWETCSVDLKNGVIEITTFNKILIHESLASSFRIDVFPAVIANLANTTFTINQRFNNINDSNLVLFPSEARVMANNADNYTLDSFSPMDISSRIQFASIEPVLPYVPGMYSFRFNLLNDLDVISYVRNNNLIVNEIRITFPPKYFGSVPSNLLCYVNELLIENCTVEFEMILIRTSLNPLDNITVGIYGYNIIPSERLDVNSSVVLFSLANRKTFSRDVFFYGKTRLLATFDKTAYVSPTKSVLANLRVVSQLFDKSSPGERSNVSLDLDVDSLNGLGAAIPFSVSNIIGSSIYITVPIDTEFVSSELYSSNSSNEFRPELIVKASRVSDAGVLSETTLSLTGIKYRGRLIWATINSEYSIDNNFRGFNVTIKNVRTTNQEDRSGLFSVDIIRSKDFRISTFPILNTSVSPVNEFNLENPTQRTLISERQYLIEYYRGVQFLYSQNKYFFQISFDSVLKPGIYGAVNVTTNSKARIPNAFTSLTVNSQSTLKSLYDKYDVDGRQNLTTKIFAGISCGSYPGRYILRMESSNTVNFHPFPNVIFNIDAASEKNIVLLYSDYSGGNATLYNSNTNIILGRGAFVNFWVKPVDIPLESLQVYFTSRINEGTTVAVPTEITIPSKSQDYVIGTFSSPDSTIAAIQSYNMLVKNNDCFISGISKVSFHPNLIMESFNEFEVQMTDFIYQNAETQINLEGIERNIPNNQINFYINYNRGSTLPIPSNFYCALYCEDREPLTVNQMKILPKPENSWFLQFFYKQIKTSDRFTMSFKNLVRDKKYKLQCYIETSEVKVNNRSSVMRVIDNFNQNPISAVSTPVLQCIDLKVYNATAEFEKKAALLIQEAFYDNFENNGCILTIDSDLSYIKGFQNNYFDCRNTTGIQVFNTTTNSTLVTERNANSRLRMRNRRFLQTTTDDDIKDEEAQIDVENTTDTDNTNNNNNNNNSTNNSTNNNNSTDNNSTHGNNTDNGSEEEHSSEEEVDDYVPYYKDYQRICLVQYSRCGQVADIPKIDNILVNLLGEPLNSTSSDAEVTARRLQEEETQDDQPVIVIAHLDNSEFRKKLTEDESDNYIGYRVWYPSSHLDINEANLELTYTSEFSISEVNGTKQTSMTFTFNGNPDKLTCFWAMNTNTREDDDVSVQQVLDCNSNENIACSPFLGTDIPSRFTRTFDISVLGNKEYAIWVTCRENSVVAREFSKPYLGLRVNTYYEREIVNFNNYVYECKLGNGDFPACCESRKPAKDDPTVCPGSYLNATLVTLLLLIAMLFN